MRHWPEENALRHTLSPIYTKSGDTGIWVSGDADPAREIEHTSEIYSAGVRNVLDVRDVSSSKSNWRPMVDMEIKRVETRDHHQDFESPRELVKHLETLAGRPLLIHCHMGVNRSASVAIIMLVILGETPGDATEAVLNSRASALGIYAPIALKNWLGDGAGFESMEAIESLRGNDRRLVDLLKRRDRETLRL
jgi:hypothetical protein